MADNAFLHVHHPSDAKGRGRIVQRLTSSKGGPQEAQDEKERLGTIIADTPDVHVCMLGEISYLYMSRHVDST
jgi:hypothetical protein